ncbi:MAG: hypothetical protein QME60_00945 [Verrucomicrobiota bacterium]|nr:hypothetical protein [Verrucomicrobiota bacterium]
MKYARIFVPLVLFLLGLGFFCFRVEQEKTRKRREAGETLAHHKANAVRCLLFIHGAVTNIAALNATAQQQARKAEDAVFAVTGAQFDREQVKRYLPLHISDTPHPKEPNQTKAEKPATAPKPPPPRDPEGILGNDQLDALRKAQKEKDSAKGDKPAASRQPFSKEPEGVLSNDQLAALRKVQEERRSETKKPEPAPQAQPAGDDDAPPGEMTRAQLDATRKRFGSARQPDEGAPAPDSPPTPEEKAPPAREPVARPRPGRLPPPRPPEIVILMGRIVGEADAIAEKAEAAHAILAFAEQAAATVAGATSPRQSTPCLLQLDEQSKTVKVCESDIQQMLFAMSEPVQNVLALKEKADKMKEQKRLAEETRKKEGAHKKLIADELAAVGDLRAKKAELLRQCRYDEMRKALAAKEAELHTDEAKAALKSHVERMTCLRNLKTFVMNSLNARPYKWGWSSGASAKDILGAAEEGIRITGGEKIAWPEVPPAQLVKIIEYCLADTSLDRKIRSEQTLAYGVFLRENGNPDGVQSRLNEIRDKFPAIKEDAERLLAP